MLEEFGEKGRLLGSCKLVKNSSSLVKALPVIISVNLIKKTPRRKMALDSEEIAFRSFSVESRKSCLKYF